MPAPVCRGKSRGGLAGSLGARQLKKTREPKAPARCDRHDGYPPDAACCSCELAQHSPTPEQGLLIGFEAAAGDRTAPGLQRTARLKTEGCRLDSGAPGALELPRHLLRFGGSLFSGARPFVRRVRLFARLSGLPGQPVGPV